VGPGKHVLEGVQIPMKMGNFERKKGRPTVKHRDTAVICAKTAEPIKMPFWVLGSDGTKESTRWEVPDPPMERRNFGERDAHCKVSTGRVYECQK